MDQIVSFKGTLSSLASKAIGPGMETDRQVLSIFPFWQPHPQHLPLGLTSECEVRYFDELATLTLANALFEIFQIG